MGNEIIAADAGPEEICARFDVSRESCARLEAYVEHLRHWQRRMNLVGAKTLPHVWARHVADALQLLPLLPRGLRHIVDLGSGAGIPGMVLAMVLGGDVEVVLVESNVKKAAFLRYVAQEAAARVTIRNERIEAVDVAAPVPAGAELITARALAPLPRLLDLAWPWLERGATGLFLKGQDVESELTEATRYWKMQVELIPSLTDEKGVILKVKEVERA